MASNSTVTPIFPTIPLDPPGAVTVALVLAAVYFFVPIGVYLRMVLQRSPAEVAVEPPPLPSKSVVDARGRRATQAALAPRRTVVLPDAPLLRPSAADAGSPKHASPPSGPARPAPTAVAATTSTAATPSSTAPSSADQLSSDKAQPRPSVVTASSPEASGTLGNGTAVASSASGARLEAHRPSLADPYGQLDEPDVPVTLTWENITYRVDAKRPKGDLEAGAGGHPPAATYQKTILHGISGVIKVRQLRAPAKRHYEARSAAQRRRAWVGASGGYQAGSLCAIMGPSGCGKSTLLDILADRKDSGYIDGKIAVNGTGSRDAASACGGPHSSRRCVQRAFLSLMARPAGGPVLPPAVGVRDAVGRAVPAPDRARDAALCRQAAAAQQHDRVGEAGARTSARPAAAAARWQMLRRL